LDRLIADYLPPVFKGFHAFMGIVDGEQVAVEALWDAVQQALEEQFIETAEENGLSRWEKALGITSRASEDYAERRFRILAVMSSQLPYTIRELEKRLVFLCTQDGYEVELDHENFSLSVSVALEARSSLETVQKLLEKMVPANIVVSADLKYNQHLHWSVWTHQALSGYTHGQLRNEVLS